MKKIILIFLIYSSFINAQNQTSLGLKAGLNKSQFLGDNLKGYNKTGFNGGIFYQIRLSKKWNGQIEMLFNNKGSHNKNQKKEIDLDQYSIALYYIDIPLLFQFQNKKIIYEIGLEIGYLVTSHEWSYNNNLGKENIKSLFNRTQNSIIAGLAYPYKEKWLFDFRYENSIMPISKIPTKKLNSVFSLSILYKIVRRT